MFLFLNGCVYGASICARTAADALVSVDNVLAVTLRNAGSGATVCACATSDALVTNLKCHCKILRKTFGREYTHTYILTHIREKSRAFLKKTEKYYQRQNLKSCLVP